MFSLLYDEKEEILYASTNNGVFYYSQSKFHLIPTVKGALGNSFFLLRKDHDGRVYSMNLQGQVFEVSREGMKIHIEFPVDQLKGNFKYIINQDNNIVCLGAQLIEYKRQNGKVVSSTVLDSNTARCPEIIQLKSGVYALGCFQSVYDDIFKSRSKTNSNIIYCKGRHVFEFDEHLFSIAENQYGSAEATLHVNDQQGRIIRSETIPHGHDNYQKIDDTTMMVLDRRAGINIGTFRKDTFHEGRILFDKEFISAIQRSSTGMLFLATFKQGIIVVPSIDFIGNESNSLLTSIRSYDEDHYVVSKRNGVLMGHQSSGGYGEVINSVDLHIDEIFVLDAHLNNRQKWGRLFSTRTNPQRNQIYLGQGDVAYTAWNGVRVINFDTSKGHYFGSSLIRSSNDEIISVRKDGRYQSIAADTVNKIIYCSKYDKLHRCNYYGQGFKQILPEECFPVSKLMFSDKRLYCGSSEHGILVLENDTIVQQITFDQGLHKSEVKRMIKRGDRLFILTGEGLQIFDLRRNTFEKFGILANLLDRKVTDFDIAPNHLLVLRKKDHFSIPFESLTGGYWPSKIYIDSFLVNGTKHNFDSNKFDYNENSMKFFVDYRDLQSKQKVVIQYKLDGFYEEWRTLRREEHEIEFQSLPVGSYVFRVRAEFEGAYSKEFSYAFEITPPFWQAWWFYALIVVATILFIGSFALIRLRRIRSKAQQRLELESSKSIALNAQLKAIRAQMNPHFVFNSINSIQDLVLQQETLKSYDYLESFSRLVRMTLDHSEREFISLKEELDFLNLYLDLESLRFEDEFEFNIDVPEELIQTNIPSLITQPFVENAIKHGLLHKNGPKKLSVVFVKSDNETITCSIEDNGVGRETASEIMARRKNVHKSFSTGAIKARLKIINNQLGADFKYEIIDLKNEKDDPIGTRVELSFPLIS